MENKSLTCIPFDNTNGISNSEKIGAYFALTWHALLVIQLLLLYRTAKKGINTIARERNFPLLFASTCGCVALITIPVRMLYGIESFSCSIFRYLCTYFPTCFTLPHVMRLYQLSRRIKWTSHLAQGITNSEINTTQAAAKESTMKNKNKSTTKHSVRIFVQIMLVSILATLIVVFLVPSHELPYCAGGCELRTVELAVMFALLVGLQSGVVGFLIALGGKPDPYKVKTEIIIALTTGDTCMFLGIIFYFLKSVSQRNLSLFAVFAANATTSFSLLFPYIANGLRRSRKVVNESAITLEDVLASTEGKMLFEKHMADEFALESLKFVLEVKTWRDTFLETEPENRQREAYRLFEVFVKDGGIFQINIPERQRLELNKAFEEARDLGLSFARDAFDDVWNEIWSLMKRDNFVRFKDTNLFEYFVNMQNSAKSSVVEQVVTSIFGNGSERLRKKSTVRGAESLR